jgi:cytochrome c556
MLSLTKSGVLAAVLTIALVGVTGIAFAQDKEAVLKDRQAAMKEQGKNLGSIKDYLDGKGDLAQAQTGAANLTQTTKKIPDLFPPGTGGLNPSGDYVAKPAIWSDWSKFLDAQKTALEKADALLIALKSGDKTQIAAAFADMGKNGCGACHTTFREKIEK